MMASLMVGMFSCNDLEEYNPSGATADTVWSTPEGFMTLVNAAYSEQRQLFGKEDGLFMFESGTDLWFNEGKGGYARQMTKYEGLTPADGNPNKKAWQVLWNSINHANAGINRIDNAGFTSQEERNSRLAELRFVRAFNYYYLVETYGGVMLRTRETQGVQLTAERSPVEDFYKLMIEDLTYAAEHLPVSFGAEYSRATKKSALGFLSKVYLSRAYYSKGAEAAPFFQKARDVAQEVINRKSEFGVDLWKSYEELWDPKNNKRNKEALYVVSNSASNTALNYDADANRLHLWFMTPYSGKPGLVRSLKYGRDNSRRLMPTLALLDFFDEKKDARYKGSFREVWIANNPFSWTAKTVAEYGKDRSLIGKTMVPGKDTALYITKRTIANERMLPYVVIDRDSTYFTSAAGAIRTGRDFVQLTKFEDPTRASIEANPGFQDIIIMRFAEMYLIAAEAELQLGNTARAAEYINVIRRRAALPGKVAEMEVAAGDIDIDFILDERARELAGEHTRWLDLKRTGKLVERVREHNPDITLIRPHHVLRPIPQVELDALTNGTEFGQNPGY
ncbi:hypothetical protein DC20_21390 (plasmid) [Rufibacter tibetensis]|uniref:Carbohydrate-binding protein SusD n=2 Tax=Rufibacter tibetensis TaxID=512763 RepID=A0A0P0D4A2_9BACT|nr:hypothetical protein DC20_21390 [Rufibacter tibetensis]